MKRLKHRSLPTSCFFLLGIITLNRLYGMVRTFLLAGIYGVSHEAAAFELAQNISATLYDCTAGALIATMFLPSYVAKRKDISRENADRFAATLALLLPLGVFFLFFPFILFPEQTVSFVANGLSHSFLRQLPCPRFLWQEFFWPSPLFSRAFCKLTENR